MYQDEKSLNNVNEELKNSESPIDEIIKVSNVSDAQLENLLNEINLLKGEIKSVKDFNIKTKDFLLLELESNLDKQTQSIFKQDSKIDSFQEVVNLLKDEDKKKISIISSLNEDIGKLKQCLVEKNKVIESLEQNIGDLNQIISVKDESISSLNEELVSLRDSVSVKDESIGSLNEELVSLRDSVSVKDESIKNLEKKFFDEKSYNEKLLEEIKDLKINLNISNNKTNILKNELLVKNETIESFEEENEILKSIINRKDENFDF